MPFEDIELVGTAPAASVPPRGVRVSSRAAAARGVPTRYIAIELGADLGKKLVLLGDETRLRLQFGTGRDAGRIAVSADVSAGLFRAKKQKSGHWKTTVNARSAEGLFTLNFPGFTVAEAEIVSLPGKCPVAVFACSAEMLAVED